MEGRNIPELSTFSGAVADRDKSDGLQTNALDCHICSKPPIDAVATSCGHIFCWPCVFPLVADKRKRKPCPVCGTFLTRDMNILTLYCGAQSTEVGASSGNVIPPRPSNPEIFMPMFARIDVPNDDGSDRGTPGSMSVLRQIEQEIDRERARNQRLENVMVAEVRGEEKQRIELARMERQLIRKKSQMALAIVRLEGQLARADQLVPNGWSDLTIVDSIENEASSQDVSSPSNQSH